jgi:hypothetical protein
MGGGVRETNLVEEEDKSEDESAYTQLDAIR